MIEEPEGPSTPPEAAGQSVESTPPQPPPSSAEQGLPTGRQAFRAVRRQMTDADLSNPAVSKMLMDELEQAETDRDEYKGYVERYHEADKRAMVLGERLKTNKAFEILSNVGIALGGVIVGLVPSQWDPLLPWRGQATLAIGVLLLLGSVLARLQRQ